jgi:hypothetical protein
MLGSRPVLAGGRIDRPDRTLAVNRIATGTMSLGSITRNVRRPVRVKAKGSFGSSLAAPEAALENDD